MLGLSACKTNESSANLLLTDFFLDEIDKVWDLFLMFLDWLELEQPDFFKIDEPLALD